MARRSHNKVNIQRRVVREESDLRTLLAYEGEQLRAMGLGRRKTRSKSSRTVPKETLQEFLARGGSITRVEN